MRKHFFQRQWEKLIRAIANAARNKSGMQVRQYPLDIRLSQKLQGLADEEQCTPGEIAADLLMTGLAQQLGWFDLQERWDDLSPREQDVAALVCLNYTTRQIAKRLYLSESTIRTHWRRVMSKFAIHSREDLRQMLADWDFGAWD